MKAIRRQFIDRVKTGKKLQELREHNDKLRRQVCKACKHDKGDCSGDCEKCEFDIDNHISRPELASVFGVSQSVIYNWESGRTAVGLEDILFYARISETALEDIIVFIEE